MAFERDVQRTATKFLVALDTPRSLAVHLLAKHGEWGQLVNLSVDPLHYRWDCFGSDLDKLRRDRAATDLLRKCRDLPTDVDLHKEAVRTFHECELKCRSQNLFLSDWFSLENDRITTLKNAPGGLIALSKKLNSARRWIRKTLGGLPDFLNGKFGPGAVFESGQFDRRLKAFGLTTYDKIRNAPVATENLSRDLEDHLVWQTVMAGAWGAALPNRVIPRVRGNRFTSVPKDAKKNRGICIEPGLNVFGQLAIGSALKLRLKRRGLLHDSAQDLHRRMARQASWDGLHATLDLSNASDTISSKLVELLLPHDWHAVLSELRSPMTEVEGRWFKLEKFSSMGNGYTFELETLIFASLAHACGCWVGVDSSVYGDDTIVPTAQAKELSQLLTLCGFTINQKKSYLSGPFRESCGGDFFGGEDVRPYYMKELPRAASDWIVIHNCIADLAGRFNMPELGSSARSAVDNIPRMDRCFGPKEFGDLVLHGPIETWTMKIKDSIRYVRAVLPIPRRKKLTRYGPHTALTAAVLGLPSGGIAPRDSVEGHRHRWLAYS